jgi:Tol biopolymer transport system component/tRNA A-37 threonylcarbamoyl transferase component Bud32
LAIAPGLTIITPDPGPSGDQPYLHFEAMSDFSIGALIGTYRIEAHIGEGGMGRVYRARDTKLNRAVAIKFLSDELADASARRRFQREAQMASSLNHPHIATVYDVGEHEGRQYIVTELIDGGTLKDWARAEKRAWKEVLELLTGVADGLAAAHQAGITHRDIKPANILVAKNGYAKLADFGLAKLAEGKTDVTRTLTESHTRAGVILGTIAYMSPEQASGRPVDARSDIFSFGILLYEVLTGRYPFTAKTDVEALKAITHDAPEPLTDELPVGLRMAVEKALEKDPAERYQGMRELVVDLKRVQRLGATAAVTQTQPAARRRPRWRMVGGVAAALILISLGVLRQLWQRDYFWRNPLGGARIQRLTDFEGLEMEPAISPDGKLAAFVSNHDGQDDVLVTQIGSGSFVNLTQGKLPTGTGGARGLLPVGFSGDGSQVWFLHITGPGQFTAHLAAPTGGNPRAFQENWVSLDWSPDGTRVVYQRAAQAGDPLFIADADGSNSRRILIEEAGIHHHYPTWSPDGRLIYYVRGNPNTAELDIWRISAEAGAAQAQPERITFHNAMVSHPVWLDSHTVIYTATAEDGSGRWLYALDVEHRIPHPVRTGLAEQYMSVAASTTAPRRLVSEVSNPSASLWAVTISEQLQKEDDIRRVAVRNTRALGASFGPDYLVYLSSTGVGDGIWKLEKGDATELWRGKDSSVVAPAAVSMDGRLCFPVRKRGRGGLYVMNANGANGRTLVDSETFDVRGSPSWSPDGKWIAVAANQGEGTRIFKVPLEGGPPVLLVKTIAYSPVWLEDGSLILYTEPQSSGPIYQVKAVTPDGQPAALPEINITGPDRLRAIPGSRAIVIVEGRGQLNFVRVDLATGQKRQLTEGTYGLEIQNFDVSPDGKEIVFDRVRDNSDIVVIDLR